MAEKSGSITINGISDSEFIKILEVKSKHEQVLIFNPQQMQAIVEQRQAMPGQQPQQKQIGYNNVILTWSTNQGLIAVLEILRALTGHHHEQAHQP